MKIVFRTALPFKLGMWTIYKQFIPHRSALKFELYIIVIVNSSKECWPAKESQGKKCTKIMTLFTGNKIVFHQHFY